MAVIEHLFIIVQHLTGSINKEFCNFKTCAEYQN